MNTSLKKFWNVCVEKWWRAEDGLAAVEAAMIFPILLTLMLATIDLGQGLLANQKTIRASQVTADLITRQSSVDANDVDEAVQAGQLAYEPMSSDGFGIDIISISFDDDANTVVEWRETRNMDPIDDLDDRVSGLAEAGNGVVVVAVEYEYEPIFSGFVIDTIPMQEIAFARGRNSAVVELE